MEHFESLYPNNSRFEEIEKILGYVKNGNSCQLIGLPGVGRSNLLGLLSFNKNVREKHLAENLPAGKAGQKWYHFVNLNFSEIRKKPLYDCLKFMLLAISESLRERRAYKGAKERFSAIEAFDVLDKIFKDAIKSSDNLVLFSGLKRAIDYLCIEKELTVVLLFDRFEEYIPMLDAEFFANLRILRNRAKYRFSVIFSLNRPLEDLIEPTIFADFYEFLAGNTVYLPLLDKAGLDFRISYLEKISGKKIDRKTIEKVLELTNGHGKLTRLCFETLLATSSLQLATSKNLKSYLLNHKSIQGALYEIWHSLTPEEQKMLTSKELNVCDYLINTGLVKDGVLTIPLLNEIVSLLRQDFGKVQQLIYDKGKNEIKKGEVVISDTLTSSEFKLLKFLLENPNKIIEREEVIKSVWTDAKSTEGVTDQALDQLIFRLRKKIEEDPNNPTHLETLKGRGIRFTPHQ